MDGQRAKFEELLSNMRENGSWGGSVEIQAFCQAYQRDVIVYADEGITPFTSVLDPSVKKGQPVHIAYHTFRHYSSVRSVDGPHDGLPVVSRPSGHGLEGQDASSEGKAEDDDGASSTDDVGEAHWPKTVAEALPGRSRAAARAELAACRAELEAVDVEKAAQEEGMTVRLYRNMFNHYKSEFDRAVACIRDLHDDDPSSQSSLDSANTSPPAPASSAAPSPATAPATAAGPSSSPTKPRRRLIRGTRPPPRTWLGSSSRSSSRNSTASKRSAGQSDDDDESDSSRPLARRQRGRDRKRRILQDVTLGISDKNDDENSDITSVRPRVSPDAVVEQAEASLNEGSTAVHERTAGVSASSATIASADDGASSNSGSNEEASTAGESDSEFEDDS
ncbi:hypothetical protein FQN49_008515 [Arthroderma sp. PD_2]|nr:hypothetical protein FQN49_008515 [Arthroderma sp. PD_2]